MDIFFTLLLYLFFLLPKDLLWSVFSVIYVDLPSLSVLLKQVSLIEVHDFLAFYAPTQLQKQCCIHYVYISFTHTV